MKAKAPSRALVAKETRAVRRSEWKYDLYQLRNNHQAQQESTTGPKDKYDQESATLNKSLTDSSNRIEVRVATTPTEHQRITTTREYESTQLRNDKKYKPSQSSETTTTSIQGVDTIHSKS